MSRLHKQTSTHAEKLQSFIDALPSPVAVLDYSRTIRAVNRSWREFVTEAGVEVPNSGIGRMYPEIFEQETASPDSTSVLREGLRRMLAGTKASHKGVLQFQPSHDLGPIFVNLAPVGASQAGDRRVLVTHDRLSSGKVASEALRNTEQFLRNFFQTTKVVRWEATDNHRTFTGVGEESDGLLGFDFEKVREPDFWERHLHPDDRREVLEAYKSAVGDRDDRHEIQYRMIGKDGQLVWIYDMFQTVRETGKETLCAGLMVNITEQKRIEQSVKRLTGRLISAQEEERKRIARELHDDLNQRVAIISIELEQLARSIAENGADAGKKIKRIQKEIEEIGTEIHIISHHLHPSKLDHLGLVPAIKGLCKEASASRDSEVEFFYDDIPRRLPKDLKLCIFRVAQEALQNAMRHSGATNIEVRLGSSDDAIDLLVKDNGSGFTATPEMLLSGLGLTSMEERLRSIDGELRIISSPGRGTIIEAVAPLHRV